MNKPLQKNDYNKLLELLYQLRTAEGLRQADLAERMGVPQSFISKVESGERRIDIMDFIDLCRCLEVEPVHVLQTFLTKLHETRS